MKMYEHWKKILTSDIASVVISTKGISVFLRFGIENQVENVTTISQRYKCQPIQAQEHHKILELTILYVISTSRIRGRQSLTILLRSKLGKNCILAAAKSRNDYRPPASCCYIVHRRNEIFRIAGSRRSPQPQNFQHLVLNAMKAFMAFLDL